MMFRSTLTTIAALGLIASTAAACRTTGRRAPERAAEPLVLPIEEASPDEDDDRAESSPGTSRSASPQSAAARALIEQARQMFEAGRLDAALNRLERAASVNPRDGEGHYWLAEVWLAKGDLIQAREHHRLAKRYLSSGDWSNRLSRQEAALR